MNEVNKVFQGLFQGAGAVADGLMERNRKNKLNELYTSSLDKLNQFLNPQATYQQDGQNIPRSQVSQNMLNGVQTEQVQNPDTKGALNYLFEQTPKFMQLGEDGKQYSNLLSQYFEANQPQQPSYDIREVGGQLVRYDKNNPGSFEVVYGEPKKEKTVYNQKFFESQTAETIKDLTPDQIKEGYFFLPKELQEQLYSNPEIKDYVDNVQNQGDYSKIKTGSIKRGGKIGNKPISFGLKKDDDKFSKLDDFNERIRGGEQLTDTEMENYNTLRLSLGKKYDLNDTQLASVIDRINEAKTTKEKNQILESLEKGDYYEDRGTNQEQIDYDRNRIIEWKQALNDAYNANDGSYDGYKQSFLQELEDFYNRGSITKKEYSDLRKSYY